MGEWKDIKSAPKNVAVLVWAPGARFLAEGELRGEDLPIVARCVDRNAILDDPKTWPPEWEWRGDLVEFDPGYPSTGAGNITIDLAPTHWHPLPAPPPAAPNAGRP